MGSTLALKGQTAVSRRFASWSDASIIAGLEADATAKLLGTRRQGSLTRSEVPLPDGRRGWIQSDAVVREAIHGEAAWSTYAKSPPGAA